MCKENPFNRKVSPSEFPKSKPAPGHGFPLIKRKVRGYLSIMKLTHYPVFSPNQNSTLVHMHVSSGADRQLCPSGGAAGGAGGAGETNGQAGAERGGDGEKLERLPEW